MLILLFVLESLDCLVVGVCVYVLSVQELPYMKTDNEFILKAIVCFGYR